jgi:hypothetical protein
MFQIFQNAEIQLLLIGFIMTAKKVIEEYTLAKSYSLETAKCHFINWYLKEVRATQGDTTYISHISYTYIYIYN